MKSILYFLQFLLISAILASCTVNGTDGPPGPRGPQGPQGPAGPEFEAIAYEFPPISFTATNNWSTLLLFDDEDLPFILESDKALVFLLQGQDDRGFDIWSPLPLTRFNEVGTYLYGYNFTRVDVEVFMDANFDFSLFNTEETDGKVFRVIIIPAEATNARSASPIDFDNYYEVMEFYGLKEAHVKKMQRSTE